MAPQPEWLEKDFYKLLGVSESASAKEITKAYRALARELHPDRNPDDPKAEDRFKEVSSAYDVLGDEATRAEYDEFRKLGPMGGMGFPGGAGGGFGPGGFTVGGDAGNLGDLLGGLFRRGGPGAPGGGGRSGPAGTSARKGTDYETELTMSFRDAAAGVTTALHITTEAACSLCSGLGSAPGTAPTPCNTCGGRGVLDDNQGFFSFSRPCATCSGRGVLITDPCSRCDGTGVEHRPREVKVRIPAGVSDGKTIKLKGRGGPGRNGGPAGDLFVKVHVEPDTTFGRSGSNLTINVPVTFAEAALGTKLRVPTLDGDPVTLKLAPGTASGTTLRVKGKGLPGAGGRHGDLLVNVEVQVPRTLTDDQRAAVEALAAASPDSPRSHLGV